MTRVTKIAPLSCPQCGSVEVSPGFNRRVKRAFVRDGNIWCYGCKKMTNTETGKVKEHQYTPLGLVEFEESPLV